MSLWKQPKPKFMAANRPTYRVETTSVDKNGKLHTKSRPIPSSELRASNSPPSLDSDIEALQLSLAQEKDRKNQNVYVAVEGLHTYIRIHTYIETCMTGG
jgi:hypothetical protein